MGPWEQVKHGWIGVLAQCWQPPWCPSSWHTLCPRPGTAKPWAPTHELVSFQMFPITFLHPHEFNMILSSWKNVNTCNLYLIFLIFSLIVLVKAFCLSRPDVYLWYGQIKRLNFPDFMAMVDGPWMATRHGWAYCVASTSTARAQWVLCKRRVEHSDDLREIIIWYNWSYVWH